MRENCISALTIPAHISQISVIKAYVEEVARNYGFEQEQIHHICTSTIDAALNIINHSHLIEENALFQVACQTNKLWLDVIVKDKSLPFTNDDIEKFNIDHLFNGKKTDTTGLCIKNEGIDWFCIHVIGYGGKEITLRKYKHAKRIDEYADEITNASSNADENRITHDELSYHIVQADAMQVLHISKEISALSGLQRMPEYMYYPERITEMLQQGFLLSVVAIRDVKKDIISHAALEIDDEKGICEIVGGFTRTEFQHPELFNETIEFLVRLSEEKKMKCLSARTDTRIPFMQNALIKNGFSTTAIFFNARQGHCKKKISEDSNVLMHYSKVASQETKTLYVSAPHQRIMQAIYNGIGTEIRLGEADDSDIESIVEKKTEVRTVLLSEVNNASIFIDEYGGDTIRTINSIHADLIKRGIESVHIYIDLSEPVSIRMTKEIEQLGYFFSGILPTEYRHYMILQYLNSTNHTPENMCICSNTGQQIFSHIKACAKQHFKTCN